MLALVDNQLARVTPVLDVVEYRVAVSTPDSKGRGRIYVYAGSEILESGVRFHVMDGKARLNPLTGEFQTKNKAVIRAIIGNSQHRDVTVGR